MRVWSKQSSISLVFYSPREVQEIGISCYLTREATTLRRVVWPYPERRRIIDEIIRPAYLPPGSAEGR